MRNAIHRRLAILTLALKGSSVVALLIGTVCPGFAFDATTQAQQQAGQISRALSQQMLERQREMQKSLGQAPQGRLPQAPQATAPGAKEACFQIGTINVTGVKLIASAIISRAALPFEGKCLGLTELNNVLQALTYLYIQRGYVASRAYLPQQDLSKGVLTVNVVEGRLEDILLKDGKGTKGQLATAFPGMKGRAANLRDVEQGLDQINRLGSNKATIALEAGKDLGDTVLAVAIDKTKPWNASIGSDTLGSPSTGLYETHASLGLDSPMGLNDQWLFSYQRSMGRNPAFFSNEVPNSDTVTASFSVPYGYLTAGVDSSWSQYHSSIQGQIYSIDTSGSSASVSPYLTWMLLRDQVSKTWVTGRLAWKSNDNFILGSRIDISSRILSIASVELGHSRQLLGGTLTASAGIDQGVRAFGAFDDASAPAGSPKGQFTKGTASLGYTRGQDIGPVTAIASTSLSGQWSSDPLFASEQMGIGGSSTVRGTRQSIFSGTDAFYVRNEISVLLPAFDNPQLTQSIGRVEPYAGIDFGRAITNAADDSLGGNLTSGTIGVRNRGGALSFDVSWSRIFSTSPLPAGTVLPKGLIQARISAQF